MDRSQSRPLQLIRSQRLNIQNSTKTTLSARCSGIKSSRPCTLPPENAIPPDTDEGSIGKLWQRVHKGERIPKSMATQNFAKQTQSWRNRKASNDSGQNPSSAQIQPQRRASSKRATLVKAAPKTATLSQATPPTNTGITLSELTNTRRNAPKVTDADFRSKVFGQFGLDVSNNWFYPETPYEHFDKKDPELQDGYQDHIAEWYKQKHPDSEVWLPLNKQEAEDSSEQYFVRAAINSTEAEFSHLGKLCFFKADKAYTPHDPGRSRSTFFRLEWGPVPDQKWCSPPAIIPVSSETESKDFTFSTKPDCTYWLTLRSINRAYREQLSNHTYVIKGAEATCPYLTIEFKREEHKTSEVAENQLVVFAATALYNRVRLRRDQLLAVKGADSMASWTENDFADIKHYGIAFTQTLATFYQAIPKLHTNSDPSNLFFREGYPWNGMLLRQIALERASLPEGYTTIQKWLNEIHNWGLGDYSEGVQNDIRLSISAKDKEHVSIGRISLNEELRAQIGLPVERHGLDESSSRASEQRSE